MTAKRGRPSPADPTFVRDCSHQYAIALYNAYPALLKAAISRDSTYVSKIRDKSIQYDANVRAILQARAQTPKGDLLETGMRWQASGYEPPPLYASMDAAYKAHLRRVVQLQQAHERKLYGTTRLERYLAAIERVEQGKPLDLEVPSSIDYGALREQEDQFL